MLRGWEERSFRNCRVATGKIFLVHGSSSEISLARSCRFSVPSLKKPPNIAQLGHVWLILDSLVPLNPPLFAILLLVISLRGHLVTLWSFSLRCTGLSFWLFLPLLWEATIPGYETYGSGVYMWYLGRNMVILSCFRKAEARGPSRLENWKSELLQIRYLPYRGLAGV